MECSGFRFRVPATCPPTHSPIRMPRHAARQTPPPSPTHLDTPPQIRLTQSCPECPAPPPPSPTHLDTPPQIRPTQSCSGSPVAPGGHAAAEDPGSHCTHAAARKGGGQGLERREVEACLHAAVMREGRGAGGRAGGRGVGGLYTCFSDARGGRGVTKGKGS